MAENPLKMMTKEPTKRQEMESKFEKLWQVDPEQFDPTRNAMERERLRRTWSLVPSNLKDFHVVDLGCGKGVISLKLLDQGAHIDAVDISQVALQSLQSEENLTPIQDYVPRTSLKDDTYDLVMCTDLIAYLPDDEYRLLFSELARIIKPSGTLICSTPLDYHTEDPIQRFATLAETEFNIEKWAISHHLFYIRLRNFFEAPYRFVRAKNDPDYRQRQLDQRVGFSKSWFRINSHVIPALFWSVVQWVSRPIASFIRQGRGLLIGLEKFCRLFWADSGVTHAIFSAKKRTIEMIPEDEQPVETKHKKQLWE